MPNELPLGARRTGNLIDFDPGTPAVSVVLERTEQGINIEIPWLTSDDYYASWFLRDTLLAPDEDPKPIPRRLTFTDSHGSLQLVDCWPRGYHSNFISGSGHMWAKYVVMGIRDDKDFLQINGARSTISGLREWLHVSSLSQSVDPDLRRLTVTGQPADEITVGPNLTLVPTWGTERPTGEDFIVIRDLVACESHSPTPGDWNKLTDTHLGIRDLLTLSRLRPEIALVTAVSRDDDPLTTLDGEEHGQQWRDVIMGKYQPPLPPITGYRPFLIEYQEIGGPAGIAKWLTLRNDFSRALDPVLSDCYLMHTPAVTHLAQVGPGLEALGYLLLKDRDGLTVTQASRASLRARLDRIGSVVSSVLPFDANKWAEEMTNAYNAIKHANRALPSELDLLNRWTESVVVVRAWVALELGVDATKLKQRLDDDPTAKPFEARS
ncbi:hypothetical protein ABUV18_03066 (plasmid) [Clavibacter nebraskensis]|uniref:ApeA N-terminal domain 1-containing protein n=1 Tax=Clavibacter nebraskensis TaxID=31963 RepID=UPI003DA728C2